MPTPKPPPKKVSAQQIAAVYETKAVTPPYRPQKAPSRELSTQLGTQLSTKLSKSFRTSGSSLFSQVVKQAPAIGGAAIAAIRSGYPAHILKAASQYFGVPDARIQRIVAVPASTASRLEKNASKIDQAASERIHRMGTVTRMAIAVFERQEDAVAWMCQSNPGLAGSAPLDLLDTEPGAIAVRQILNALATGGAV